MLGALLVETGKGSFLISDVFASGDWVIVTDSQNRILLYSLSSGEQKGKVFGRRAKLSRPGGLLCVENDRGKLSLYDLSSLQKRDEFVFASPVSLVQFDGEGKRLFVLTANQTAYVLNVSGLTRTSASATSHQ